MDYTEDIILKLLTIQLRHQATHSVFSSFKTSLFFPARNPASEHSSHHPTTNRHHLLGHSHLTPNWQYACTQISGSLSLYREYRPSQDKQPFYT